jgi:hypothetical protein
MLRKDILLDALTIHKTVLASTLNGLNYRDICNKGANGVCGVGLRPYHLLSSVVICCQPLPSTDLMTLPSMALYFLLGTTTPPRFNKYVQPSS